MAGMFQAPCQGAADQTRPRRRLECEGLIKRKSKLTLQSSAVQSSGGLVELGGGGGRLGRRSDKQHSSVNQMWFNAAVSCRVAWGFSCRHWQLWWERTFLFHQDLYLNWDRLAFSLLLFFFSYRWLSEDSSVFHREQDLCRTALCSNTWCTFISFNNKRTLCSCNHPPADVLLLLLLFDAHAASHVNWFMPLIANAVCWAEWFYLPFFLLAVWRFF